mgnify:CR=1 FL=1|tara:strand:- start:7229 stop:8098 length:870 start_codon:yes stop_codon:yes gene_type:complete
MAKFTKKKFKQRICHPKIRKTQKQNNFCLTNKNLLISLKNKYNLRHPDVKIKSKNPQNIHNELQNKLSGVCHEEQCWLTHLYSNQSKNIINEYFAPEYPLQWKKNKNTWLNSLDISKVMKQYEDTYDNFRFLGPSPIDFETIKNGICIYPEICNLNLKEMKSKGINKIGIIFNTDYHYESGSHWICVFINLNDNIFFFFDSTGDSPQKEIKQLFKKLKIQNKKLKYKSNEKTKHQYKDTECGVYCLYVVVNLLENKTTINKLKKQRISDETIEKYRHYFFNHPIYNKNN